MFIGGSEVEDVYNYNVVKSTSENNSSSEFSTIINNIKGVNQTKYIVGDEVNVYADKDVVGGSPYTLIFTGILEDKKFTGKEQKEILSLAGRDYSARLMDRTVEPEVYSNLLAGSITKDIIAKYVDGITTTNVKDGVVIDRMTFNHMPVYDAVKKLADLSNYMFYVDENKDLHFEPKASVSSGQTFDNTNILKSNFKEQRDTIYNQVWVYGDRYLDSYKQTFTAGSPLGGSVFSLLYNPHNTQITVGGSIIQPGGVEGMTLTPGSGVKYLVGYNDKRIVFVSGTTLGNFIPTSGNQVIVDYLRALPIVKVGDNESSKSQYGTRVKVIQDTDIKDPATAEQILARELDKYSFPSKEGNLNIRGVVNITPGQTCVVNIPYHNVINQSYDILEAKYDFSKENNLSDSVLSVKVNRKIPDITDTMKDIILELKKLKGADISTSDVLTRFQYVIGSMSIRQSGLVAYSRYIGSDYLWGVSQITNPFVWGISGSGLWVGSYAYPNYNINWSGGYLT